MLKRKRTEAASKLMKLDSFLKTTVPVDSTSIGPKINDKNDAEIAIAQSSTNEINTVPSTSIEPKINDKNDAEFAIVQSSSNEINTVPSTSIEPKITDKKDAEIAIAQSSTNEINTGDFCATDNCATNAFIITQDYPTDRANFPDELSDDMKKFILRNGPCKPKGPFPKDPQQENRSFSNKYYEKYTKTGLKIAREWLCYSLKKDVAYCEACWLFSEIKNMQSSWINGVRDWKGLSKKLTTHEISIAHLNACVIFNIWRKNYTVDTNLESELKKETSKWIKILDRIVNVTVTLAASNLPFRGHREKIGDLNSGNFLSIVELLSKYDPVLQELITTPKYTHKYLSPKIQNELIQLLSRNVENAILKQIKSAQFFSIIMDTTQDINKNDQLSQIIRYVTISEDEVGRPIKLNINESFLGFKEITDQTGQGLTDEILNSLEAKGLPLSKCRGQGYDGASNMSGVYKGVKTRILEKQTAAKYIHCAAHNLNLVLNDAISKIPENTAFFNVVEELYVFFSRSTKRWELLNFTYLTLKKLCPTRWSSRHDSLTALRYNYVVIMKAITKIILMSSTSDEKTKATSLKTSMETFEFVFQVVIHSIIFESTNIVSKVLQKPDIDLAKANDLLNNATEELSYIRDNYDTAVVTATAIAQEWGVNTEFKNKRKRKVKKHFDELCEDERLSDPNMYFKTAVFCGTLDIIINEITNRFEGMTNVVNIFSVLTPEFLSSASDEKLNEQSTQLSQEYEEDLRQDFVTQMLSFRKALRGEIKKRKSIKEMAELLFIDNFSVACSVPDVCTAYLLFLTLPVTVASAERTFSKLKLIKNYLRSTMLQERLSGLSMLSIEGETARSINITEIINTFAAQNAVRSRKFL